MLKRYIDETGKTYGYLTVLHKDIISTKRAKWICQCICGKIVSVEGRNLRKGDTSSCGCYQKEVNACDKRIDEIGKRYGKLLVLCEDKEKTRLKREVYWKCLCDCGKYCSVLGYVLRRGDTISCGCVRNPHGDMFIIGKRFGNLLVEKKDYNKNGRPYYITKCDCGATISTRRYQLISGTTKSCGCIKSKGEYEISRLLSHSNIQYQKQFRCQIQGHFLFFDFLVENDSGNHIVEFDGTQHKKPVSFFKTNIKQVQFYDKIKNQYCFDNDIPIIRIPYEKLGKITLLDLFPDTSDFLLKKDG